MNAPRGQAAGGGAAPEETVLTRFVLRLLLPSTLVVAIAFLVKGHSGSGGGFAGALVAGAGILYGYLGFGPAAMRRMALVRWARALCGAGLVLALSVGFGPVLLGRPPFTHFPSPGSPAPALGHLHLHSGFLFEAGLFLLTFGFLVAAMDGIVGSRTRMPDGEGGET